LRHTGDAVPQHMEFATKVIPYMSPRHEQAVPNCVRHVIVNGDSYSIGTASPPKTEEGSLATFAPPRLRRHWHTANVNTRLRIQVFQQRSIVSRRPSQSPYFCLSATGYHACGRASGDPLSAACPVAQPALIPQQGPCGALGKMTSVPRTFTIATAHRYR
jgi:hypothetical protein